ncbi:pentatricopeptide repeat-containing protein At4g21705, mitochondrial-like [Aristolochia californica]|uniref:pentatricopeptide repeat-containing protein At4g21705, mitochondrial-like n=1 Tax=Aristolochia californica TaxID=171875 RepID=UPI0035D6720A
MSSSLFSTMNRLRRTLQWSGFSPTRLYASKRGGQNTLYAKLSPLGNPNISLVPELDRWAYKGTKVSTAELNRIIRDLRMRRRYKQALEVSEWMGVKCSLRSSDHAVQLDLIGRVHGLDSAETYFNNLNEKDLNEKTYGALLNCYVREKLTERSLSHMQKMKELGFASSALPYNDLMCLYTNTGQYERIPELLAEMKENKVVPDNFSYRICINSYGERSDIEGMEKVLEEMEGQAHIVMDWNTYAAVANAYRKAGLTDKAVSALKESEKKLEGETKAEGYNFLITLHGSLGNKLEVERLWKCKKASKKVINKDYISMLGALVKLNEFEDAKSLLKEWETCANNFDFRVPNVLLIGYCQRGMLEKAEAMLEEIMKKGKVPIPNSFGILAAAFVEKGDMGKAFEYMKKAISSYPGNEGWRPTPTVIKKLLQWLGEEGRVEEVEGFVGLLSAVIPMDRGMYHTLIKANIREGKEYKEILESMEANNIKPDEVTKEILGSRHE